MSEVVSERARCGRQLGTAVPGLPLIVAGLVAVLVSLCAGPARADRYEASAHAHAIGGVAWVGDPAAPSPAPVALAGLGVRASYTRSNRFQYDAQLTVATTAPAALGPGRFVFDDEVVVAPFAVTTRLARFDLGLTWRGGVRVIPTARLALGVQQRWRTAPVVHLGPIDRDDADGRPAASDLELVGVTGLGLDLRLGPHLVVGGSIGGSAAAPLGAPRWLSVELSAHLAYYGYPLWLD